MNVRCIEEKDILNFEVIGTDKGIPKLNLQKWIEAGRTKLEWCFVVEEKGIFLGRIIYGIFEDQPADLKIWQFLVNDDKSDLAENLLKESLMLLSENKYNSVEYHMYSSPNRNIEIIQSIFEKQGFRIVQEKKNYEIEIKNHIGTNQRLKFRKLSEIDERQFILAIEDVTVNTLDRDDLENNTRYGSKKAAEMYYELLKEIDFNCEMWKLAYDMNDELVGLVVPQRFDNERGVINYIGVVAEKRGNAYIDELIEEASRIMSAEGIKICIAEIDVLNKPLENALIRKGYTFNRLLTVLNLENMGNHVI